MLGVTDKFRGGDGASDESNEINLDRTDEFAIVRALTCLVLVVGMRLDRCDLKLLLRCWKGDSEEVFLLLADM